MQKIQATIIKDQIFSNSKEAYDLFNKSRFGEKEEQKIIYSISEALYLLESKKIKITDLHDKILDKKTLLKKFSRLNKNFLTNYTIFKDLREKGYVVKTALKFGATFRIYDKNKSSAHSKWLCYPTREKSRSTWQDFTAKNRVAHSAKKNLLIAIVDEENSPTYYEISWVKP